MSDLTDRIAAEHRDALYIDTADAIICKGCGETIFDIAHHIANVTEAAVREQVARDIEAARTDASSWVAERHLAAWQAALAAAARIARGGAA